MKLEQIGFYTLSNHRAKNTSIYSDLMRCEMILTDKCNFNCPYCRGVSDYFKGDIDFNQALYTLDLWINNNLQNIRFSGGEPTLYNNLDMLVKKAKLGNIKRIAISTNGSAPFSYYEYLIECGVNDFSISLDACCSSTGKHMCGNIENMWEIVINNIERLSKLTYVSVGVVLTKNNIHEMIDIIKLSDKLQVSDIRIISAAQYDELSNDLNNINNNILNKYPILKYRVNNYKNKKNVRGIKENNSHKCYLMMDDMAVIKDMHFPCIIYLREGGNPVGFVNENMRYERLEWINNHDIHNDIICSKNCLDVCVDYNDKVYEYKLKKGN